MLKFQRFDPAPALSAFIHGYWQVDAGDEAEVLDFVPDGHPELFFLSEKGLQLKVGEKVRDFPRMGLLGQLSQRSFTTLNPGDRVVYVKLYPWTPYLLFGVPSSETLDEVVDLGALTSDASFRQLGSDILGTESIPGFVANLDAFFLDKMGLFEMGNPFISFAVRQIYQSNGTTSIESLTENIRASRRYVEKVFKKCIGMPPKQYARLIRVKKASLLLLSDEFSGQISHVAAELEYYDQSHFLKDFKAVARRTPTNFLRQKGNLPLDRVGDYLGQWDYS